MRRSERTEHLDEGGIDHDALVQSLRDVGVVNRWLGGYRGLRRHLQDLRNRGRNGGDPQDGADRHHEADRHPGPDRPHGADRRDGDDSGDGRRHHDEGDGELLVLDVGAGDAATLEHLRAWAPPHWTFVGAEIHPQILGIARERVRGTTRIHLLGADGLRLPFRSGTFDVVLCTLTLHHFDDSGAVRLIREMARVARRRVLVNDLERNVLNYLGALGLACTAWLLHPVTRHDGPISVRRAFTIPELARIAHAAGLTDVRIRRHFPFRLVLQADVE